MFTKLALLSLVALAWAKPQHPAAQFPAGVNPQDCPGFPICDNARLHNPNKWQQPWQPQPSWQQPQPSWQQPQPQWGAPAPSWQPQPQWGAPAPAAGGDKFPAGVNPHSCPNYPFCDVNAGGSAAPAPPLPGWTERQYPAGVSPHTCPNFPYCN
ncbi:hypothetical protein DOY81_000375 [Sarcophaga bullata]|nr:hypothetical protein DOY81_000375 [Sarcophaga bullata]